MDTGHTGVCTAYTAYQKETKAKLRQWNGCDSPVDHPCMPEAHGHHNTHVCVYVCLYVRTLNYHTWMLPMAGTQHITVET